MFYQQYDDNEFKDFHIGQDLKSSLSNGANNNFLGTKYNPPNV